jgi:hypothetical protein
VLLCIQVVQTNNNESNSRKKRKKQQLFIANKQTKCEPAMKARNFNLKI